MPGWVVHSIGTDVYLLPPLEMQVCWISSGQKLFKIKHKQRDQLTWAAIRPLEAAFSLSVFKANPAMSTNLSEEQNATFDLGTKQSNDRDELEIPSCQFNSNRCGLFWNLPLMPKMSCLREKLTTWLQTQKRFPRHCLCWPDSHPHCDSWSWLCPRWLGLSQTCSSCPQIRSILGHSWVLKSNLWEWF